MINAVLKDLWRRILLSHFSKSSRGFSKHLIDKAMENESPKKSSIANSILAKFQQVNKEKEDNAKKVLNSKENPALFPQKTNKKRQLSDEPLHEGISEKDVGIKKYISEHSGFSGIIKHRFTDFQVHEIDLDGNVVELTTTAPIDPPVENAENHVNKDVLTKNTWEEIDDMLTSEANKVIEIDVSDKEKSERSIIHKTIKHVYGSKVCSNTVVKNDMTFICVLKATNKDRMFWPENLPQYLHFTVSKKNMDSTHFIYLFAKRLRVKPNRFTYAGTKDRRAITTQRMCIRKRKAEDLAAQILWGVKVGNYEYKFKPLRLGDLSGNKFTIVIRNVKEDDSVVNEAFENLSRTGFINYFGLQRFGCSVVAPTYKIGKAIIQKDWKLAVELILKPRYDEKAPGWVKAARESWWNTRDTSNALRHLSKHQNSIEFKVLKALKSNPTDYHGALQSIPRNTLLLYLHSYQSYIWNHVISRRIEKYHMVPQVGDIVLDTTEPLLEEDISCNEPEPLPDNVLEEEAAEEAPANENSDAKKHVPVRFLTEEDVKTTSIYDIVYPLPGHDVEFPKNDIAEWYEELLKIDELSLEHFKSNNKLYSLYGTYRKAFQKATDLSWKTVKHDRFDDDLVLAEIERMENISLPEQSGEGTYKSVIVDISLKPSTYATMALREAMKADTSTSFHATLTRTVNEHEEKKIKMSDENAGSMKIVNGEKT